MVYLTRLDASGSDVLSEFVRRSRPWHTEPVGLPPRLRRVLVGLVGVDLVWAALLATIVASPCVGTVCQVATLGHPEVLLGCAAASLVLLVVLAPFTGWLSRSSGRQLVGVVGAGVTGAVSLLGVAAMLFVVLILVVVALAFIAAMTLTP